MEQKSRNGNCKNIKNEGSSPGDPVLLGSWSLAATVDRILKWPQRFSPAGIHALDNALPFSVGEDFERDRITRL